MHEIWPKIAGASGAKAFTLCAGLVTLMATARLLGPEGRGEIAAVTTWVGLFATVGYLSLGQVAIHRATASAGRPWFAATFGSLLTLGSTLTLVGWAVAAGLFAATDGEVFKHLSGTLLVLAFLALPFHIWEYYGSALFMATDQLAVYNWAQILGRIVGLIGVLGLLALGWGAVGVLLGMLAAQAIVALYGIRRLIEQADGPILPDFTTIRELISGGLKLHLNAIGTLLFTSVNVLIVNHIAGPTETGHFQLATQLVGLLMILPQAGGMVLYGQVAKEGPDGAWATYRQVLLFQMGGLAALAAAAGLLAPWAIPQVAGPAFEPAVGLFQLLLLALLGMAASTLMAPQWIGRGLFWQASALSLSVGIVNVLANFLLVPRLGMYGAAWAMLLSYSVALLTNAGLALWIDRRWSFHAA